MADFCVGYAKIRVILTKLFYMLLLLTLCSRVNLIDEIRYKQMSARLKPVDFSRIGEGVEPVPDKFCDSTTCVINLSILFCFSLLLQSFSQFTITSCIKILQGFTPLHKLHLATVHSAKFTTCAVSQTGYCMIQIA